MKKIETDHNKKLMTNGLIAPLILFFINCAYANITPINPNYEGLDRLDLSVEDLITYSKTSLRRESITLLYLFDSRGAFVTYGCNTGKNGNSSYYLPTDRSDPRWVNYVNIAVDSITQCQWTIGDNLKPDLTDLTRLTLIYADGHYPTQPFLFSGLIIEDMKVVPSPNPTACSSDISQNIDFGIITHRGSSVHGNRSSGSITTVCDNSATGKLSVNNGSNLSNADGSSIEFEYPRNITIEKGVQSVTPIFGVLNNPPRIPGAYKWYVPVQIEYE
ncbi:hypothetical protein NMR30_003010 [Vibrio cholerae]|nr:hypothetical protein [Vibrio cholerae]